MITEIEIAQTKEPFEAVTGSGTRYRFRQANDDNGDREIMQNGKLLFLGYILGPIDSPKKLIVGEQMLICERKERRKTISTSPISEIILT